MRGTTVVMVTTAERVIAVRAGLGRGCAVSVSWLVTQVEVSCGVQLAVTLVWVIGADVCVAGDCAILFYRCALSRGSLAAQSPIG